MSIIHFKTKCIAIYNLENIELKDFKKFIRIVLNMNKLKISMFNSFFVKKNCKIYPKNRSRICMNNRLTCIKYTHIPIN